MAFESWQLATLDEVLRNSPETVVEPLRTQEDRCSIRPGELLKVAFRIEEASGVIYKRVWYTATERIDGDPPRYKAKCGHQYREEDVPKTIDFGPEHVYRMEGRHFSLWGAEGIPALLHNGDEPPRNDDGEVISECSERIMDFRANGNRHAHAIYAQLAYEKWQWPPLESLLYSGADLLRSDAPDISQ
jgi:hypothetical protein